MIKFEKMDNERYWCMACSAIAKCEDFDVICEDKNCKYKVRLESYLPPESEKNKFDTDLDANIIINNNECISNEKNNIKNNLRSSTGGKSINGKRTSDRITQMTKNSPVFPEKISGTKRNRGPNYSPDESNTIFKALKYHNYNLTLVMNDPRIKLLNRTEGSIKRHIDYLKGQKNSIISPP